MTARDKLTGYKTLVLINLGMALVMFTLRLWIATAVRQIVAGEPTGVDGPAEFAIASLGTLVVTPVILILLIVPAVITIWQSAKMLEQKTLSRKSVWLMLAVVGIVVELVAVFI